MNSRERLLRCYFNREIDRPAVYSRTLFPINDPSYDKLKLFLRNNSDLKAGWDARCIESDYQIEKRVEPYSDDFNYVVEILHTPAGDLESTKFEYLNGMQSINKTYFIKTKEDGEKFLSLSNPVLGGDVSSFFMLDNEMGDRGIIDVKLGQNPAGSIAHLMGSETFAMMSITDREIIHELCQRQMNIKMNCVKFLLESNVEPYFSMEGEEMIVPPLHGPDDFYDFNVKYDKPIIDLIHNSGGKVHIHCHGSVKKVLKGFIDMGVDVLHPFEAPPMGDIKPSEAKNMIRGKICYEGNIQIDAMYDHTPEQIREETEILIKEVFDDHKGLIVCPTASPYIIGKGDVCFNQYKSMVDAVINWKG